MISEAHVVRNARSGHSDLLSVGQYLPTDYVLVKYSTRPGDATRLRDSRVIAPRSIKAGYFRD